MFWRDYPNVKQSVIWRWSLKFCKGFPHCSKCIYIHYLNMRNDFFKGFLHLSECVQIHSLNITTEIFWGVALLIKVCEYPISEYNNWNFERGSPTDFPLPLYLTQLSGSTNNSINFIFFYRSIFTRWGGLVSPPNYFSSTIFEKFRVLLPKSI